MKAIIAENYGDPSHLKIIDIPAPAPGEGEVLVKVKAAPVNDFDQAPDTRPQTPGTRPQAPDTK